MCVSAMKPLQALKAVEVSVISWKQLKREPVLYTRVTSSLSPTSHLAWMCIITGSTVLFKDMSKSFKLPGNKNLLRLRVFVHLRLQTGFPVCVGGWGWRPPPPPAPSSGTGTWTGNVSGTEEARDSSELTHPHHGYRWLCFLPSLFKTSRKDEPYSSLVVASVSVNKMHHFTVKPSAEALWFTSSQVYRRIHIHSSSAQEHHSAYSRYSHPGLFLPQFAFFCRCGDWKIEY